MPGYYGVSGIFMFVNVEGSVYSVFYIFDGFMFLLCLSMALFGWGLCLKRPLS
jgi:hypothetical protein